ncbi:MAG: hypothetical protein ACHQT7_02280 [Candidatus Levyibacteriota bacterium]
MTAESVRSNSPLDAHPAGAPYRQTSLPQLKEATPNRISGEITYLGDTGVPLLPGCEAIISDVVHNKPGFRMVEVSCTGDGCEIRRIFAAKIGQTNSEAIGQMLNVLCGRKEKAAPATQVPLISS